MCWRTPIPYVGLSNVSGNVTFFLSVSSELVKCPSGQICASRKCTFEPKTDWFCASFGTKILSVSSGLKSALPGMQKVASGIAKMVDFDVKTVDFGGQKTVHFFGIGKCPPGTVPECHFWRQKCIFSLQNHHFPKKWTGFWPPKMPKKVTFFAIFCHFFAKNRLFGPNPR